MLTTCVYSWFVVMLCIEEALLSLVLQISPSHVQSKVNSHGKDDDREEHDADDHSHQRAVVLASIQRTCVGGGEKDVLKKNDASYVVQLMDGKVTHK